MTYAYIRISTDKQHTENQRFEVENYCSREGLHVDCWIEETVSGSKDYSQRALGRLLRRVGRDDLIVCAELSRLGRSLFMIMEILSVCMSRGCRLHTIKDNYRLGDDISSKVLAFAFGLSAEIERNLIRQRTREALARLRAEGRTLGRPRGALGRHNKLHGRDECLQRLFAQGLGVTEVARRMGVSRTTLYRYLRDKDLKTSFKNVVRNNKK